MSDVQLYLGDCLEVMPTLEAQSFDAIIADLPYGTTACEWDTVIPFAPLWAEYKRLIKPRGAIVLFGSQPFTSLLVTSNLDWFKYQWVWNKRISANYLSSKHMPLIIHEDVCIFSQAGTNTGAKILLTYNPIMEPRDKTRYSSSNGNDNGNRKNPKYHHLRGRDNASVEYKERYPTTILDFSNADRTKSIHPTQKPVALLEYLVRTYTNPGDVVLDNVMGSGTTMVACIQTGRRGVGIEKDPVHFATAQRRIAEAQLQPFLPYPEPQPAAARQESLL